MLGVILDESNHKIFLVSREMIYSVLPKTNPNRIFCLGQLSNPIQYLRQIS